jgi:hypothetical protein
MKDKEQLRTVVRKNLKSVIRSVNGALRGEGLRKIEPVLHRIGRGQQLPPWYGNLKARGTLPNLDGKSIGSVVEMVLVGVLETGVLAREGIKLKINPARGVDLPDLDLGVKSPSENYCTSEPFFSAYERLYGNDHDVLVLLTDYQERKNTPPLRLQITNWEYLTGPELADENLCSVARQHRNWLLQENEVWAKKLFKFLAFVNQSDWLAKQLLEGLAILKHPQRLADFVHAARNDFERQNKKRAKKSRPPIAEDDLAVIQGLLNVTPSALGIIDAADNWVVETFHEVGRTPNTNEWNRLKKGPLNGRIGVSAALQWRYNFGRLFNSRVP